MELKNLNIDSQLKLVFSSALIVLFSIAWYAPVSAIFGWEDSPFIFIAAFLWISLKVFQLRFLSHSASFKTDPTEFRINLVQRYLILYIMIFLAEITYFTFRGFWYTDVILNIIELFLLLSMISIYRKIRKVDLEKLIEKRRDEEEERARSAEENSKAEEQRKMVEAYKTEQEERKRKAEAERREKIRKLEEEEAHIKKLAEIASLIKQFSFDIPVNLDRIWELLNDRFIENVEILDYISEDEVESLLIELLTYQTDLGEYLELEQVFIKRSKINKNVDEVISKTKSNPFSAIHVCSVCNTAQPVLSRRCSNCDNVLPFCSICSRGFAEEDNLSRCQHCQSKFHNVHIIAYIQSKGMCPVCKGKLNRKSLLSH